nr:hypothetical protein [Streptomyces ureilyticus]
MEDTEGRLGHERVDAPADDVLLGVAEQPLGTGVPGPDEVAGADRDHGVVGGGHDGRESGFGTPRGFQLGVQGYQAAIGVVRLLAQLVHQLRAARQFGLLRGRIVGDPGARYVPHV